MLNTSPKLHALSVPRHQCHQCSACCSSYRIGPLLADDLERLADALPAVRAAFPEKDLSDPFWRSTREGTVGVFLSKRDGMCVFFEAGTGCSVHAAA